MENSVLNLVKTETTIQNKGVDLYNLKFNDLHNS